MIHSIMKFSMWLESKQFERLIPKEVLDLVPALKNKAEQLTQMYFRDKTSVSPYTSFAKIPDTFEKGKLIDVAFLSMEEWKKRGLSGQGVASRAGIPDTNNQRVVWYRIPMTGLDTIYHELVHAYDPKFVKGMSKPEIKNGFQSMTTAHEVDAQIGGFIDLMKEKLHNSDHDERAELISELEHWLRKNKTEQDLEQMPRLLAGMPVWHLKQDRKIWGKFLTSVYSVLSNFKTSIS